jgi:hypothetical protein
VDCDNREFGEELFCIEDEIYIYIYIYIYRAYTKEWCGIKLFTFETAPFFCVWPVYITNFGRRWRSGSLTVDID